MDFRFVASAINSVKAYPLLFLLQGISLTCDNVHNGGIAHVRKSNYINLKQ